MVLATVILFVGCILIWYGGIEMYNMNFQTGLAELGPEIATHAPFFSCKDQYNYLWNNASSPSTYIKDEVRMWVCMS